MNSVLKVIKSRCRSFRKLSIQLPRAGESRNCKAILAPMLAIDLQKLALTGCLCPHRRRS